MGSVATFLVLRVDPPKCAEGFKKALDEQFCTAKNPLAGVCCLIVARKEERFVLVPLLAKPPGLVKTIMTKGFKKSAEAGGFRVKAVKISATGKTLDELRGDYDVLVKATLA